MNDGTTDELSVSFPADPVFTRIGRVTIAGLALRLGIDISMVERLRMAVDTAVGALSGQGRIRVKASWRPGELLISLANADAAIADRTGLADELASIIGFDAETGRNSVQVEGGNVVLDIVTTTAT